MYTRMLRQFHPVGQGAFYTEHIVCNHEKFNVVYDCGSSTRKTIVEDQIQKSFKEGETIHALFISHLHEDHINGIPFLIKYCNVEKLFFPLISDVNRLILLQELDEQNFSNNFTYQFISNPKRAINNLQNSGRIKPQLVAVQEVTLDSLNNNNTFVLDSNSPSQTNSEEQIFDLSIPSGTNINTSRLNGIWVYIPFNFDQNNRKQELEVVLRKSDILVCNGKFIQYGKTLSPTEAIKVTKRSYDKITGKRNGNSMTVYSGPLSRISSIYGPEYFHIVDKDLLDNFLFICRNFCDNEFFDYYYWDYFFYKRCRHLVDRFLIKNMNLGCLYTGDYDASTNTYFDTLKAYYKKYWPTISCFQVPHHGSKNNFNIGLIEKNKVYIISAGKRNKYRHPSATVLKKIHLNGGYPFVITEDFSSYLAQTFCFDF